MASIKISIKINAELRPCIVKGKKALFHKWSDRSSILDPSPKIGGHSGGVLKYTAGIIEYENGAVTECHPSEIKFKDGRFNEYCFND